jgi:hypothetical protein
MIIRRIATFFVGTAVVATVQAQSFDRSLCSKSDEGTAFCDPLEKLFNAAKSNPPKPGETDAEVLTRLGGFLNNVNPTGTHARSTVLDAITRSSAIQSVTSQINKQASTALVQAANQLNTNQQLGPGSSAAGTTSLVTKAGSATLMDLALDTGTLTRTVNGGTATLTANADEIYRLITGSGEIVCSMNCKSGPVEKRLLDPLNFAASFALAQSSSTSAPATGQASGTTPTNVSTVAIPSGAGKLTAFTAKYEILNRFDPRNSKFKTAWDSAATPLMSGAITAGDAVEAVYAELLKDKNFVAAQARADADDMALVNAATKDSNGSALVDAFESLWTRAMNSALTDANLPALVATATQDLAAFRTSWNKAAANVIGTMASAQYTFNKAMNQPETHDFTFIFAQSFGKNGNNDNGTLTFNGAASIYNGALPAGAKYGRIHYGQVSAEYDRNVTSATKNYQWQLNIAGYWQYQPQPSVLNIAAGTVAPGTDISLPNGTQEFVGTAGSLWVTQAGLTIKGPNGVNIPLAVSWSNKTDLLKGTKVGAQIGINYNFSTISGLF